MNEITKQLWDDMLHEEHEPSDTEIFCLVLFTMVVGFVVGFMVGVSY